MSGIGHKLTPPLLLGVDFFVRTLQRGRHLVKAPPQVPNFIITQNPQTDIVIAFSNLVGQLTQPFDPNGN